MAKIDASDHHNCETSPLAKIKKSPNSGSIETKAAKPLEWVFSDGVGPIAPASFHCYRCCHLYCRLSFFSAVRHLAHKSCVLECFKECIGMLQRVYCWRRHTTDLPFRQRNGVTKMKNSKNPALSRKINGSSLCLSFLNRLASLNAIRGQL